MDTRNMNNNQMNMEMVMCADGKNTQEAMLPMGMAEQTGTTDYTLYYRDSLARLKDSDAAKEYLHKQGIQFHTACQFAIGYDSEWKSQTGLDNKESQGTPHLIIPISPTSYVAYDMQTGERTKVGEEGILNVAALQSVNKKRPVFIVGEEMDAIALGEIGEDAISLGRAENADILLSKIKEADLGRMFVLSLNSDDSWEPACRLIQKELGELNISCVTENIAGTHKDLNAALMADREELRDAAKQAKQKLNLNLDAVGNYITYKMDIDITEFKKNSRRKTGFKNLDRLLGAVHPGLYAVGAASSIGKTTFIHQMADKMAAKKQHVLYFSFEQSSLELVAKSFARMAAIKNINTTLTSLDVRYGVKDPVEDIREEYLKTVGNYLTIISCGKEHSISKIINYVQEYMRRTGIKPIVMVDYLQMIPADPCYKGTKKDLIDTEVAELKWLSRYENIPVFVISSINRSNYMSPIDFESFKESGGIEYTADVVLGIQLKIVSDDRFDAIKSIKKKRDMIREAKNKNPREVQVVCLKNRYGISSFSTDFNYYMKHDLFVPAEEAETDSGKNTEKAAEKKSKRL